MTAKQCLVGAQRRFVCGHDDDDSATGMDAGQYMLSDSLTDPSPLMDKDIDAETDVR
jgi:hypothetical protein